MAYWDDKNQRQYMVTRDPKDDNKHILRSTKGKYAESYHYIGFPFSKSTFDILVQMYGLGNIAKSLSEFTDEQWESLHLMESLNGQ